MKKINLILKQILEKVEPSKEELDIIKNSLKEFLKNLKKRLKLLKINAEIFVGGSFAKNTIIKKDCYDVDIFIRFNKKYKDNEISNLTKRVVKSFKNVSIIHGSRDYFRIKVNSHFFIELIPVIKIKNPEQAKNITDLSYLHVKYINKKIKSQKLLDEIRIAKAFCYAKQCYGAESYIQGFSGYALELLVSYYGSFLKFIKAITRINDKKIIIDIEKYYKNKQRVLMDLNSSKLQSPIILIDPTYKQRNVLAALSEKTFERFKKECKKFLKNPSIKAFEIKKTDLKKIKKDAEKKKFEFILIQAKTDKQEGSIAGSKLLKFYKHLNYEIKKFFEVKNKGFNYNRKKSARYFFVVKNKKKILFRGPSIKDVRNLKKFKKKHKKNFIQSGRIYAREPAPKSLKRFINSWKRKNKKRIKEMAIKELKIIKEI